MTSWQAVVGEKGELLASVALMGRGPGRRGGQVGWWDDASRGTWGGEKKKKKKHQETYRHCPWYAKEDAS